MTTPQELVDDFLDSGASVELSGLGYLARHLCWRAQLSVDDAFVRVVRQLLIRAKDEPRLVVVSVRHCRWRFTPAKTAS